MKSVSGPSVPRIGRHAATSGTLISTIFDPPTLYGEASAVKLERLGPGLASHLDLLM
jgi:hypothetical protein